MNPDPMMLSLTLQGDRQIVLERRFAAPPERVFDAFTREDLVPRWLDTPSWPMTTCRIDLSVGGDIRYEWAGEGGSMGMSGTWRAIERPHRLEHTEVFDEDWTGGEVHVVTEFVEEGRGTLLRMTLTYGSATSRDAVAASGMARGMELNYLSLEDWLAGRSPLFVVDPERDLVIDRIVPAPPSRVWAAWTQPEQLVRWFAPDPWTVARVDVEARPGGPFGVVMRSPDGDEMDGGAGCVLMAIEHRLLVWTDALGPGLAPRDEGFFSTIVRLTPHHEGTHYQVIVRHGDAAGRARHEEMGFEVGWNKAADQLVAVVTS